MHSQAEPAEPGNEQALIEMCITIRAEPGNEIVSIISTPYRDVYNDKGRAWERDSEYNFNPLSRCV